MHPFTSLSAAFALALLLAPAAPGGPQATAEAPAPVTTKEQDALVGEFLGLDFHLSAARKRQREILARLDAVPALTPAQVKAWEKKLDKLQEKGRTLETSGDNWLFEADKRARSAPRGRYIVGGTTKKPQGLLIAMHGGGAGSGDAGSAAGAYGPAASKLRWVMIAPEVLEKTEHGWTDAGSEEFVLELVDRALRTWKLDPDRVYFAGHSMGGYGSWTLGGHHADRVAAIAPSAGAPTPILGREDGKPTDIIEGVIPSLRNVFVSIYQSLDDVQVPPAPNQCAVKGLLAAAAKWGGFEHDYWEVDGRGHGEPPGGPIAQLEKIASRARDPVPERIVWQPVLSWKRQFHWLWWETPTRNAILVADLDRGTNSVAITCDKEVRDLWVLLDERVLDLGKPVRVTLNGEETFNGKVDPSLGALVLGSLHPDPKLRFAARVPGFARAP